MSWYFGFFSDEVFEDTELDYFNNPDHEISFFVDDQSPDSDEIDPDETGDSYLEDASLLEDDLQDLVLVQSDQIDYSDQLVLLQEEMISLNALVEANNHLLSALLFLLVFWFCYNRIKNAVRLFTGRKFEK